MVDFNKHLPKTNKSKKIDPCEIYETLDRSSDKGPLRPVQEEILKEWNNTHKDKKDVIVKLHTGQGKTLIGLLMLQSLLNQDKGPAIYLCQNQYLVDQTCQQAAAFGIRFTNAKANEHISDEFFNSETILITSVNKLFNGLSKFGVGSKYEKVGAIVLDDAHACMETIKNACRITIDKSNIKNKNLYMELFKLFGQEIEKQGVGTYYNIVNESYDDFISVPYWDWQEKNSDVASIISKYKELDCIKYSWEILKNILPSCNCVISGTHIEISPHIIPVESWGSYCHANHRIFMSATLVDDSFCIKDLGLSRETIENPLYPKTEKWSGEKMILIPSLLDASLGRNECIDLIVSNKNKWLASGGIVVLTSSFSKARDWENKNCIIAKKETIQAEIDKLRKKQQDNIVVLANRYDGIDLPDSACRVLIFDTKPYAERLSDRYYEQCRPNSEILNVRYAQLIEQGLGRAVRGEKDYCAIVIIGMELIRILRSRKTKQYFADQTNKQIEIGLQISELAKDDIALGANSGAVVVKLINQILERDDGWKEFYSQNMNNSYHIKTNKRVLDILEKEKVADQYYQSGKYKDAVDTIQQIIDAYIESEEERGWYLQEMGRYAYAYSKVEANKYQNSAYGKNRYLFKPLNMTIQVGNISTIPIMRIENIIKWIKEQGKDELLITINAITSNLRFGVNHDKFEKALDDIGKALGFITERPDKEMKEGPDNLWKIDDNNYVIFECKNCVSLDRADINKHEVGQMNNSCTWFKSNYPNCSAKFLMISPAKNVTKSVYFCEPVELILEKQIKYLIKNITSFYNDIALLDINSISEAKTQDLLNTHKLDKSNILSSTYSVKPITT